MGGRLNLLPWPKVSFLQETSNSKTRLGSEFLGQLWVAARDRVHNFTEHVPLSSLLTQGFPVPGSAVKQFGLGIISVPQMPKSLACISESLLKWVPDSKSAVLTVPRPNQQLNGPRLPPDDLMSRGYYQTS